MTTIVLDNSGCPVFNKNGVLQTIDGMEEIKQRIIQLFKTEQGTRPFMPKFGFNNDLLYESIGEVDFEDQIKASILETMTADVIYDVDGILSLDVEFDKDTQYLNISMNLSTTKGTLNETLGFDLNEL